MITQQQIKNFLEAGMIADALGVPVEFEERDTYTVTAMQGHGTYNQPEGSWSDDSSLTLCLAETLAQDGDPEACMQKFVAYMEQGAYTPGGALFDIGNATRAAVIDFAVHGVPAVKAGGRSQWSNGNGALMRIAPLAFSSLHLDRRARQQLTRDYTTITHGHIRSIIASDLYIECLRNLLLGQPLLQAISEAWRIIAYGDYPTDELALFRRIHDVHFAETTRQDIHSSGYVIDSFEAAMWCALKGRSLAEVCLLAVNLGEDTDTIAQIAACLYVAGHFDERAPRDCQETLIHTPEADQIINAFAKRFAEKL
ncbi:MAG: ADP-ribosylglycohydrolase family protein [Lacticaseibacillus songhuajiangensis]|jgi:ADP-ribosylglycohydrolase|nr:ADP-ribosylglycohydrolase family protein [Lacticaseibacillus songhuajiangensis]